MSEKQSSKGTTAIQTLTRPWKIYVTEPLKRKSSSGSPVIMVLGFAALIVAGTFLLMLPISSRTGQVTLPVDALFTAVSAVCVTGLAVFDTVTYWSFFGQIVIISLVQLGGLGFMTSATLLILALGRKIGLKERLLIGEWMGGAKLGGLIGLLMQIAAFTVVIEAAGAAILYFHFSDLGMERPLWPAIFHAVSAFNNAGFDLMGGFKSLTEYHGDPTLLFTITALTLLGGISYVVLMDIFVKRRFSMLTLDSKIVLTTTGSIIVISMFVILLSEFINPSTLSPLPIPDRFLAAFFQAASARTSGFAAIDTLSLTPYCLVLMIVIMFIGGSTGSTASGIKVNTFGILLATLMSSIRGREHASAFGRELVPQQIYRAIAVLTLSFCIVIVTLFLLTITEKQDFLHLFFETVSAFGNVGLSAGITPLLSIPGKMIITVTMFIGRLGPLAMLLTLIERQQPSLYRYPQEPIRIG
jgi:trk system potassium uptake protein